MASPWIIHDRHVEVARNAMLWPGTPWIVDTYRDERKAAWKVDGIRRNKAAAFRPAKEWTAYRESTVVKVIYVGKPRSKTTQPVTD